MSNTIGNTVNVTFVNTNKSIQGKVDTGATTSSLHATNIQSKGNQVSFVCPELSQNTITVDADGGQEVRTADGGVSERPTIKLDVQINGITIAGALFNLNDRGQMDCPLLIGQNILKAGDFVIDVNQDKIQEDIELELPDNTVEPLVIGGAPSEVEPDTSQVDQLVKEAVQTLIQHNVSLADILRIASE